MGIFSSRKSAPAPAPAPKPAPALDLTPQFIRKDKPLVVKCCLEKLQNVDIIVNSTHRSLRLFAGGGVSQTIARAGGPQIQRDLNADYPQGIKPGEIAVTKGYNLPYKYVYHCSLQHIENKFSHHKIREIVSACLQKAKDQGQNSIAFPAIGTGFMGFHFRVLRAMYCASLEFLIADPEFEVYLIIHPSMTELVDYVKKINQFEELARLRYPVTLPEGWPQEDGIQRIELQDTDADYQDVKKKFEETIERDVTIIKIEKIFNKRLYIAYERYKNTLLNGKSTEKFLWHGTKEDSIDGIVQHGFDMRLTERATFGKGCYFATNASYSDYDAFAAPNDSDEKFMFLVRVVTGICIKGHVDINDCTIPEGVQSTVDDDKTTYVTFKDDQQYPAFIVKYEHV